MKIAVIGTGIAGGVVSYLLAADHDLTVFEQNDHLVGHANTVRVDAADGAHDVGTGFIVFNEERYPGFVRLLENLGVESRLSSMSFSVHSEVDGLECSFGLGKVGTLGEAQGPRETAAGRLAAST